MSAGYRRGGSTPRLIIALSVASVLAVFLLYTSLAGSATPSLTPRSRGRPQRRGHDRRRRRRARSAATRTASGLRFTLQEIGGTATVPVVYRGSVPDLFKLGRHVFMQGRLRGGVFEAVPDSLVTKCPSKYAAKSKA